LEKTDFDLIEMFSNATGGFKEALGKLTETAKKAGMNMATAGILRGALFGYIEGYLNGATCSKCFTRVGDAKDFPNFMVCPVCGQKATVVKITPLRFYLSIANDADFFEVIPNQIKMNQNMLPMIGKYSKGVMDFYDAIELSAIMEPLLAWMKEKRPDLYYTLAFYPSAPDYIQMLYDLRFSNLTNDEKDEMAKELGLKSRNDIERVILQAMDEAIENRSIYLVLSQGKYLTKTNSVAEAEDFMRQTAEEHSNMKYTKLPGVNTYALKVFNRQVESMKNKMRYVLMDAFAV